ncbi:prevent-host-death protein [uncultured Cellulomonas sp.]|uniref:type II toxin-antitoxin system Phd/YefM family antitoxin n=1 Tax=uncultured Cellulomonas sp. TaxID=189682 RepID=UPI0028ED69D0|nr:prevent-host-death protein [uncultured Cellulomonas sp.]
MRTMTATEASRGFSDLLDAVENGETVLVMRGNRTIAQISPAPARTGRDLRLALAHVPPLDDAIERDIAAATSLLTEAGDPWAGV